MTGYSDRINHAFAFAAKHHDREVRKGTRLPYLTHPANIAIILTRYGQDEDTVLSGILLNVVEDYVRDGWTREEVADRLEEKFGALVLDTTLAIATRKFDDDGYELDRDEQRADYLTRLARAGDRSRWLAAADHVHNGASLIADLGRTVDPDSVWSRFAAGRVGTERWYRAVYERLVEIGFSGAILEELKGVSSAISKFGS
jgi:(p)ppGpp synthase/HD superfamily hydrolase